MEFVLFPLRERRTLLFYSCSIILSHRAYAVYHPFDSQKARVLFFRGQILLFSQFRSDLNVGTHKLCFSSFFSEILGVFLRWERHIKTKNQQEKIRLVSTIAKVLGLYHLSKCRNCVVLFVFKFITCNYVVQRSQGCQKS